MIQVVGILVCYLLVPLNHGVNAQAPNFSDNPWSTTPCLLFFSLPALSTSSHTGPASREWLQTWSVFHLEGRIVSQFTHNYRVFVTWPSDRISKRSMLLLHCCEVLEAEAGFEYTAPLSSEGEMKPWWTTQKDGRHERPSSKYNLSAQAFYRLYLIVLSNHKNQQSSWWFNMN